MPTMTSEATISPLGQEKQHELDRIRRLLYERECVTLKEQLHVKSDELETIRQEKTRITKSFWQTRTKAMSLLQALTTKKEKLKARMTATAPSSSDGTAGADEELLENKDRLSTSSTASTVSSTSSHAGERMDVQALQALQSIISDLHAATDAATGAAAAEEEAEEVGVVAAHPPSPVAPALAAEKLKGAEGTAHCAKCLQRLDSGGSEEEDEPSPARSQVQEEEFDLEVFKLKRQACKLRDELAKKRFAELAMSVKLKETEEEVGRLAVELKEKEAEVERLQLEVEEKNMRLMDCISRVHDIEVRLEVVSRERDEMFFHKAKEDYEEDMRKEAEQEVEEEEAATKQEVDSSAKPSEDTPSSSPPQQPQAHEENKEEDGPLTPARAKMAAENMLAELASSPSSKGENEEEEEEEDDEYEQHYAVLGNLAMLLTQHEDDVVVEKKGDEEEEDFEGMAVFKHWTTPLGLTILALAAFGLCSLLGRAFSSSSPLPPPPPAAAILTTPPVVLTPPVSPPPPPPPAVKEVPVPPTFFFSPPTPKEPSAAEKSAALAATWVGWTQSPLYELTPGGASLRAGEILSSCGLPITLGEEEALLAVCPAPFFLWMQTDGNLVLYRGLHPTFHRGPVWSSNTMVRWVGDGAAERNNWSGNVSAVLSSARTLKLVDEEGGGRVVWQRRVWRLPQQLTPWPFARPVLPFFGGRAEE